MFEPLTMEDLAVLAESADLECKAAQSADGKGELIQFILQPGNHVVMHPFFLSRNLNQNN